jgi:hypothetical protein
LERVSEKTAAAPRRGQENKGRVRSRSGRGNEPQLCYLLRRDIVLTRFHHAALFARHWTTVVRLPDLARVEQVRKRLQALALLTASSSTSAAWSLPGPTVTVLGGGAAHFEGTLRHFARC